MGHTPYRSANTSTAKKTGVSRNSTSAQYTRSNAGKVGNNPKAYHPGITHNMAVAQAEKEKQKSSEEAADAKQRKRKKLMKQKNKLKPLNSKVSIALYPLQKPNPKSQRALLYLSNLTILLIVF
jgi:hypothetical protein